jgi:hypothetical protein
VTGTAPARAVLKYKPEPMMPLIPSEVSQSRTLG